MSEASRTIWSIAFLLFFLLLKSGASAQQRTAALTVPEFFVVSDLSNVCQFRVSMADDGPGLERKSLFQLLEAAYNHTNGWKKDFAIVGVDYIKGGRFHFLLFSGCSSTSASRTRVLSVVHDLFNEQCVGICHPPTITVAEDPAPTYAMSLKQFSFKSQVDMFSHYNPELSVSECAVKIALGNAYSSGFSSSQLFHFLILARNEYRVPILDIQQINRSVYLLFSRQCEAKKKLYSTIQKILQRGKVDATPFKTVDFSPDVREYVFFATGKR